MRPCGIYVVEFPEKIIKVGRSGALTQRYLNSNPRMVRAVWFGMLVSSPVRAEAKLINWMAERYPRHSGREWFLKASFKKASDACCDIAIEAGFVDPMLGCGHPLFRSVYGLGCDVVRHERKIRKALKGEVKA